MGCGVLDEVKLLFTCRKMKLMQCKLLLRMVECAQKMLTMIVEERKEQYSSETTRIHQPFTEAFNRLSLIRKRYFRFCKGQIQCRDKVPIKNWGALCSIVPVPIIIARKSLVASDKWGSFRVENRYTQHMGKCIHVKCE